MSKVAKKIKATVRVYEWLWKAVQHRAIEEGITAEAVVTQALVDHLGIKSGDPKFVVTNAGRKKGGN